MMTTMKLAHRCLLLLILAAAFPEHADAFVTRSSSSPRSSSRLHGISEWRDEVIMCESGDPFSMTREVPLHLVPSSEVPLPGETKYFQFQTEEELRLFQQAMDRHHGIFGLGLLVSPVSMGDIETVDGDVIERQDEEPQQSRDETMVETIALMEIVDYKNMNLDVDLGVFVTAQVVGRAAAQSVKDFNGDDIVDGVENQGPIIAECLESLDEPETHFTLEEVNTMAKDVVEMIARISQQEESSMEHDDDDDIERRTDRFQKALRAVYESDSQGYTMSSSAFPGLRSWKELNAISWAAFSSSSSPQWEETHRLYALDMKRITMRIQLASFWLSDVLLATEKAAKNM